MNPKNLTRNILLGMGLGLIVGVACNRLGTDVPGVTFVVDGLFPLVGRIFVKSLQLLVVPLVLFSLICGTASLNDLRRLGRIGAKTVAFYLGTTALAVGSAIVLGILLQPGVGFNLSYESDFAVRSSPPLADVILGIFPSNPFQSLAEGKMLQVIVFSILFGIAMCLAGEAGQRVLRVASDLNEVVMKLVILLMLVAPFGVFALVGRTFAQEGFTAILALGKYFFLVLGALVLHLFVTYGLLFKLGTGLSPMRLMRKMRKVQLFAFSTASSNATLPLTLETVEHQLGVKPSVGSFTIPLGATINMDGTAILQGVATVFIAQALQIDVGVQGYLMVVLMSTLASIGTAGVPGVGLIMLAMVFQQVGLPVAAIGVIYGVDRLLDMVRTAVNVTGDAVVSVIVAKSEGEFDQTVFDAVDET
ncbi:dicarboxylate/amino acid:cation symporter [Synoicihabitans lomoniglobus]|uniref:Dicarboxylate/amino acid:cation symporter n=1 Tax=Synoicihabitans lomoniglobus TaxID=2909285 RepID=A0AAF0I1S5_9BACT|nr:dicarboxylate/amino acid:cation symporter [Opitutaceae bacterium LMO-M01]WED65997.1 dicarboxylate/amino acid:cation symporter [Opitutaceae bacterium LMO-M01]